MNQFSYTRLEKLDKPTVNGEEQAPEFKKMTDTINLNLVIRSVERPDGSRLVVLNDFHEEVRPVPIRNSKGVVTGMKNERNTYQSEVLLNAEDAVRFMEAVTAVVF